MSTGAPASARQPLSPGALDLLNLSKSLTDIYAMPPQPRRWRFDKVLAIGGRGMLIAPAKAGKSTFMSNMVRSLVDGDLFLGEIGVEPLQRGERVVLINLEMQESDLQSWMQGVKNSDQVTVLTLEGLESKFNVFDATKRRYWIEALSELNCKVLIVDCAAPAVLTVGKRESSDLGEFVVHVGEIVKGAGISECVVVHHTGTTDKTRGRGDSHIAGWGTTKMVLAMDKENDTTCRRWFFATGRDVQFPKRALDHDPQTRRLTLVPEGKMPAITVGQMASRRLSAAELAMHDVIGVLNSATAPLSFKDIEIRLTALHRNHSAASIRKGLSEGEVQKLIVVSGPKNRLMYAVP